MVDFISGSVGEIGRFQITRMAIVFFVTFPGLAHVFSLVFAMSKTDFWCADDVYDDSGSNNLTRVSKWCGVDQICDEGFDYDRSFWTNTIIMEYDLVCDRAYLVVAARFSFFIGFGLGVFASGIVSDRFGRKFAITIFSQILFGTGILSTVMPNVESFMVIWFFVGASSVSVFTISYVWAIESVGAKWRLISSVIFGFAWPLSRFLLALTAYLSRDWKITFQVLSALHIVTPLVMTLVPESARWLVTVGRHEEALAVVNETLEKNGQKRMAKESFDKLIADYNQPSKESLLTVFKAPQLRWTMLIMYWNWSAASFSVNGLDFNWQTLTDSVFQNFLVSAALSIPIRFVALAILLRRKVRIPIMLSYFASGVFFLLTLSINRGDYVNDWPIVVFAILAKLSLLFSFTFIYTLTAEAVPTSVRNASIGSCSFVARIGTVCANFVSLLAEVSLNLPIIMFACSVLIGAVLSFWLPELGDRPMANTMVEIMRRDDEEKNDKKELKD